MGVRPARSAVAAVIAIGAVLALARCDDSAVEGVVAPGDQDLGAQVTAFCRETLARMDCTCFWRKAGPAFNAGNVTAILKALSERDRYGPMITRGRLEKATGEEGTSRIGRALYDCVDLKGH